MTSDQLQRHYALIQESLDTKSVPLNLAMISRWYGSQSEARRQELETVEPLTWLKHLPRRAQRLSRWHLPARIMEEFIAAQTSPRHSEPHRMESIPEGHSLQALPRPLIHHQSLERRRPSFDDKFQSPRSSFDVESRRSGESVLSSNVSGSSNPVVSPIPSIKQYGRQRAWTPSYPENTGSGTEDLTRTPPTIETSPDKPPNKRTALPPGLGDLRNGALIDLGDNLPKLVLPVPDRDEATTESKPSPSPATRSRSNLESPGMSRKFASSPLLRHTPPSDDPQKDIQDEEAMQREYEQKIAYVSFLAYHGACVEFFSLLEDTMAHNQRIRQLLNRISISVKEYDTAQRTAMNALGKKYQALPKELVESFGHDPAAVTGATRRLRGWRAVEDIHQRLIRQREVFSTFIAMESRKTSDHESILDDKVSSLTRSLAILEERKEKLAERAKEVESVLRDVQKVYKDAKKDYDKTMSLTSALYPEVRSYLLTSTSMPPAHLGLL